MLDQRTSNLLRWYRQEVLKALDADPNGDLFALPGGQRRGSPSLSEGIRGAIRHHVGIHMTPHQFRHLAAKLYLDVHPEDFETVRQLLGHSFGKTTLMYAGLSGERASKACGAIVLETRASLKRPPNKLAGSSKAKSATSRTRPEGHSKPDNQARSLFTSEEED